MGVRLIVGRVEGGEMEVVAMYDSTTGRAFGPVWEGRNGLAESAWEEAEEFLDWLAGRDMDARKVDDLERELAAFRLDTGRSYDDEGEPMYRDETLAAWGLLEAGQSQPVPEVVREP